MVFKKLNCTDTAPLKHPEPKDDRRRRSAKLRESEAMEERLESIRVRLSQGAPGALRLTRLIEMATRVARPMADEMLDWRVLFQDRPLVPPG